MNKLTYLIVVGCMLNCLPLIAQSVKKLEYSILNKIEISDDGFLIKSFVTEKKIPDWRLSSSIFYTYYYNNAILQNQGSYYGKLLNGRYYKFTEEHQLIEQGKYKQGVKTGVWSYWDESGALQQRIKWRKGKKTKSLLGEELSTSSEAGQSKKRFGFKFKNKKSGDSDSDKKSKGPKASKKTKDTKGKKPKKD